MLVNLRACLLTVSLIADTREYLCLKLLVSMSIVCKQTSTIYSKMRRSQILKSVKTVGYAVIIEVEGVDPKAKKHLWLLRIT